MSERRTWKLVAVCGRVCGWKSAGIAFKVKWVNYKSTIFFVLDPCPIPFTYASLQMQNLNFSSNFFLLFVGSYISLC